MIKLKTIPTTASTKNKLIKGETITVAIIPIGLTLPNSHIHTGDVAIKALADEETEFAMYGGKIKAIYCIIKFPQTKIPSKAA